MMKKLKLMQLSAFILLFVFVAADLFANGKVHHAEYSTSLSEATGVVRIIVACFGGLIGMLGIIVAFKSVGGSSDVTVSFAEHQKLSLRRIGQGTIIALMGTAILIGAIYLLPDKRTVTDVEGKSIVIDGAHIEAAK